VPGDVAPTLLYMSGDVAFLLKIFFWEAEKIFCRRTINFCVDRIFFFVLHGVMAQMGLAMLGIELVRAFLLLSLAANLTHSFSLTSHICFNRFSKTRSLPCFKSCGRSDECNQHAIPVQQQGQPSSRRFFFHRAIRGISAAVVSNTVFRSSSFAEEVNNLKLTDIYFGVGCFWHIQHEFGKQEMKFNYQVRLYFSTICSSLISF